MEDFNFWWYIIAAVIYFLTRGKKKKQQPASRPGTENTPPKSQQPKSFEELLREITEGPSEEQPEPVKQEPVVIDRQQEERRREREREEARRLEGERRAFADDESRRVYEESIKMAEGADLKFEPDEKFRKPGLFKNQEEEEEETSSFAAQIRNGLISDEAKKAVIYAEILNRKY